MGEVLKCKVVGLVKREVGSGKWEVGSGKWEVGSGELPAHAMPAHVDGTQVIRIERIKTDFPLSR